LGLEKALSERGLLIEEALRERKPRGESASVQAAVDWSLLAPAKRLRPILALLVTETLQGDPKSVLPAGCAVEMVHTASLILDDLPCMDDAALRRGKPACHVEFGVETAILAAFALQNRAFEILAEGWAFGPSASTRVLLAQELAKAIGPSGMIAGQAADLETTGVAIDLSTLEFIHSRKTGALFIASAAIGALVAGAAEKDRAAIVAYAKNLGLAFQVVDDLIDAVSKAEEAGKDVGKDLKKTTFVSFAGVEGARQLARELVGASQEALAGFGPRARALLDLASYVIARRR